MSTERKQGPEVRRGCVCPYCDREVVELALPFCEACHVELRYCVRCEIPVPRDAEVCPECGAPLGEQA